MLQERRHERYDGLGQRFKRAPVTPTSFGEAKMKWRVVLEQDHETKDWAVWCPELPGCTSAGTTEKEALDSIREAIELYIEPSPLELEKGAITREVAV